MASADELTCSDCRFWRRLPAEESGGQEGAGQCRRRLHSAVLSRPVVAAPRVAVAANGGPPRLEVVPDPISFDPPAPADLPACGEFQGGKR